MQIPPRRVSSATGHLGIPESRNKGSLSNLRKNGTATPKNKMRKVKEKLHVPKTVSDKIRKKKVSAEPKKVSPPSSRSPKSSSMKRIKIVTEVSPRSRQWEPIIKIGTDETGPVNIDTKPVGTAEEPTNATSYLD